jgi:hypothetical protein
VNHETGAPRKVTPAPLADPNDTTAAVPAATAKPWPKPSPRLRWVGPPQYGYASRDYSPDELIEARLDRLEATLAARGIEPVEPDR